MKRAALVALALVAVTVFSAPALATGKVVDIGTTAAYNYIPWWGSSYNSMRFQCLWFQSTIGYAGYIQAIHWDRGTYTTGGTYNDVRVWLCHSTKTALEATFNNNYTGNTPVQVMSKASFTLPAGPGWVDTGIDPNKFNYNNSNNLLMEVRWNGDGGVGNPCARTSQANSRVYATSHTATTGSVQNNGQRIRLYIATMTALEPTSLGRVKTLFR